MQAWCATSDDMSFALAGRTEIPAARPPWTSDDPWQAYLVGDPWEGCEDIERESQEEWCADFLQLLTVKDSAKEAEAHLQSLFARCLATGAEEEEPLHACMRPQSMASLSTMTDSPSSSSTSMRPSMASSASTDAGTGAPSLRRRWGNDMLGVQDHEADDSMAAFDGQHAAWVSPPGAPLPSKCNLGDSTLPRPSTPCRRGAAMMLSRRASAAQIAPPHVQESTSCSLKPTMVTDTTCPVMLPPTPRRAVGASKEDVTHASPGTPRGLRSLDGEASQMSREAQPVLGGDLHPLFLGGNCAVDTATFTVQTAPMRNIAAPLLGGSLTRMGQQHRMFASQTFQASQQPTRSQWSTADDAGCLNNMAATDAVHRMVVDRPIRL